MIYFTAANALVCLSLVMVTFGQAWGAAEPVLLASDSRTAVIVVDGADETEGLAARELAGHVQLISGRTLPVIGSNDPVPEGHLPVYLGVAADPKLREILQSEGADVSSFILRVEPGRLDIVGATPMATLYGVYELLEQLGVRWYLPGEIGRVLPEEPVVSVQEQFTRQSPSMELRLLQPYTSEQTITPWILRARLGGDDRPTGAHGIPPFHGPERQQLFEEHPECFALVDGKRQLRQISPGNPLTLQKTIDWIRANHEPTKERIYIPMGPDDGEGWCEAPESVALDGDVLDPFFGKPAVTGRYIQFFNQILDALEDDYPGLHIVWYVYSLHMMPPPEGIRPNPRIVGALAPITLDRIRGMDNPMSLDRHALRSLVEQWSDFQPNELFYRGYYNNLACPQFPLSQIDRVRTEIPYFKKKGINVMRVEVIGQSWASNPITLYLATRLMWNSEADVDGLLAEFYARFYGPAEDSMKAYHEAVEAAFRDSHDSTGGSFPYLAIYDMDRRETMRGFLKEAADKSPVDSVYSRRVAMALDAFTRLELFLDCIQARNRFDFVEAMHKLEEYQALTDRMVEEVLEATPVRPDMFSHSMVSPSEHSSRKQNYFARFWAPAVLSGYKRAVEKGEIVHVFPDEWQFLADPTGLGEIAGFQRPEFAGPGWRPLKTISASWSDQGLHYYKGDAWYRTEFHLDSRPGGKPVYLWFAGVDEEAEVWLNGRFLGSNLAPEEGLPGVPGTFLPFDLNATDALSEDGTNTLVVKVTNARLDELGTGGIVGPVMLWSPKDPGWKPGE